MSCTVLIFVWYDSGIMQGSKRVVGMMYVQAIIRTTLFGTNSKVPRGDSTKSGGLLWRYSYGQAYEKRPTP